jgi:hypothetical protein
MFFEREGMLFNNPEPGEATLLKPETATSDSPRTPS